MVTDPIQLLRRLEPAVRPAGAPGAGAPATTPFERRSFQELLTLVADGRVRSDRPVRIDFDTDDPPTAEQLERLAAGGDLAAAAGAETALMLIDGRALVMDVPARTLVGALEGADTPRLVEIDAAVLVADDDASSSVPLGPPAAPVRGLAGPLITD